MILGIFMVRSLVKRHRSISQEEILEILHSPFVPKVSMIVPMRKGRIETMEYLFNLMALQYGNYELILVLDDNPKLLAELKNEFILSKYDLGSLPFPIVGEMEYYRSERPGFRKLSVVTKNAQSLADMMNAGLNVASGQYVTFVSREGVLHRDALIKLIKPFLENDSSTLISSAAIRLNEFRFGLAQEALRMIRRFFLTGSDWDSSKAADAFCEGIGMTSRNNIFHAGGFNLNSSDPLRELVLRIVLYHTKRSFKGKLAYVPELVLTSNLEHYYKPTVLQRAGMYINLIKSKLSISSITALFPFLAPSFPVLSLWICVLTVILIGPTSGIISFSAAVTFFLGFYSFLICSSFVAILIDQHFTEQKYKRGDVLRLIAASFVQPLKIT